MIIYAATKGFADDVPVSDISDFNAELRDFLGQQHPEIGADIAKTKDLSSENEAKLSKAVDGLQRDVVRRQGYRLDRYGFAERHTPSDRLGTQHEQDHQGHAVTAQ